MALPLAAAVVAAGLAGAGAAFAQAPDAPAAPVPPPPESVDGSLTSECRVPGSKLYRLAPLPVVKAAVNDARAVRVLVVGTPAGGSSFSATPPYPVRLRGELERQFAGIEIDVTHRGLTSEVAAGAAELVRAATAEIEPDLVVWQVGTNDALARVELDEFRDSLRETLAWLKGHEIDVVLVDPQYSAAIGADEYYGSFVEAIATAAEEVRVPLVRRFETMRYLATKESGPQAGGFALNALGKRCIAEHVARAIAKSSRMDAPAEATNALSR